MGERTVKKRKYTAGQIIHKLRDGDVLPGQHARTC
jgi:hypothetical protein